MEISCYFIYGILIMQLQIHWICWYFS